MNTMLPASRPRITPEEVQSILRERIHEKNMFAALLGIRGYYDDSMGVVDANDRGIYDDAMILYHSRIIYPFNANTDPSVARKGIAVLKTGVWLYRIGIHGLNKPKEKQYEALVQADAVTVMRDGIGDDTGWFGINIHRGARASTSSLGCQTIPPMQWDEFIEKTRIAMRQSGSRTIRYLLIDESERHK